MLNRRDNTCISRLNDKFQPMRCRNYVEQTTFIVLIPILLFRINFLSCNKKNEIVPFGGSVQTVGLGTFFIMNAGKYAI